ncbi:glutathione S-transferase LANCL1 [Scleropages formosus]|uniref:Glutathione S-transferase LANCL1 n=1 Tax=Scleropages formosus TaxID=113540 RepID=A0A8C9SKK9_SCLFO|nr:glutathione S-transferase LANCL1 [Scleropages formosus]XP_018587883.1 glutathione S-transferase LANCL1 [Scleropages formosus]XP_018587884.1 glutathione S-transferase LANCL1 [Scleropages formosus]
MEQRAIKNPYRDYDGAHGLFDHHGRITADFAARVSSKISELLFHMENGLKSADPRDCSGYTGWTGIALLYLHLHNVFGESSFLQKALDYVSRSLQCLTGRWVTFLCGDAGPLAVAAVVFHRLQRRHEADECLSRLLQYHHSVMKGHGSLPDELLYGRVGYLYALVFVNQQFEQEKIPVQYIQQICEVVLVSGESLSKKSRNEEQSPLLYEWHQEYYVGVAHGLAGIYYFLMQPGFGVGEDRLLRLVKPSVDYLCHLKFPSGNYPACIGDAHDLLVHWCHGAPGVIYMLLQAYKVFGVAQYLVDALQCGEVIWQRGLLKKGYGLCHGAAGNGYAFLALYKLTHDPKHLYRACVFAEWCMDYGKHSCRTPDRPFSLFEGMAGTIYFLGDLLQPMKSKFPAFEI